MRLFPVFPFLISVLLAISAWAQPAPGPGEPPRHVSPEVAADRRVTFRLFAPKASEVVLTGEFLTADQKLTKDAAGLWSVTVGPVSPETYHYHFTVDGTRVHDAGNPNLKIGSTPGTIMNILEVRGAEPFFYDGRDVPHGEIRTNWYHSKSLGTLRRVSVYVPPGYDRNPSARYPVLYLLHGANLDETAWIRFGKANLILDNLIAEGKALPFIVVMPLGYAVPPNGPQTRNTDEFSRDLRGDLMPYIEGQYRTKPGRENRGLFGLSMGAGQSLVIGLGHQEIFSHVGSFSSGSLIGADLPKVYANLIADPAKTNASLSIFWVGCGTEDPRIEATRAFDRFLTERGVRHVYGETSGDHTFIVWRKFLHQAAPLLFRGGAPR